MFSAAMRARLGLLMCGLLFTGSLGVLIRGSLSASTISQPTASVQSADRVTLVMNQ